MAGGKAGSMPPDDDRLLMFPRIVYTRWLASSYEVVAPNRVWFRHHHCARESDPTIPPMLRRARLWITNRVPRIVNGDFRQD